MGASAKIDLGELTAESVPGPVEYAVVTPAGDHPGPLPLCIVLHGGGGSRASLVDCVPLFEKWWADGSVPPMVLASPSAGMSYYIEHPAAGIEWDTFITETFLPHLRATVNIRADRASTMIAGMSMGGYGALKIAFVHPELFGAVAAMEPVLEPGLRDSDIGARNRMHHSAGGPAELVGLRRQSALFEANNPANRAIANAGKIRESGLAIYLEAGDNDFINVHDGVEFLHRILWQLDISHEYRLKRGADHVGPTVIPRMRDTFTWLGEVLAAETSTDDPAIRTLRAQIDPERARAIAADPTTTRRYGILPQ